MKSKTKRVKLYSEYVEVPKEIKLTRICSRKCTILGDRVFSYDTEVAKIDHNAKILFVKERAFRYSLRTTRHIKEVEVKFELTLFTSHDFKTIKKGDYTHSFTY